MKKLILTLTLTVIFLCLSTTAFAAEFANATDTLKIKLNGEVKRAKEIGSGNGIQFTLPSLDAVTSTDYVLDGIELALFEKKQGDSAWQIYKNASGVESKRKMITDVSSLNITLDFGTVSDYRIGAKYKLAYRYYVKAITDLSKTEIAGQSTKDGWRLVGEPDPLTATDNGFMFYVNSVPTISVNNILFDVQTGLSIDINGIRSFSYTPAQMANIYLPSNGLANGIRVNVTANDYDLEDKLSVGYKLIDKNSGQIIADRPLDSNLSPNTTQTYTITDSTTFANIDLVMYVTDNWNGRFDSSTINLKIDKTPPYVVSQFQSFGRAIKGKNLYSKFTITDDNNIALSNGNVYYTLKKKNTIGQYVTLTGYDTIRLPNDANGNYIVDLYNIDDGEYAVSLDIFDKAYNKITNSLFLTMDNTPPNIRFVPQTENINATLYNTWVNYSKNIIVDATDANNTKTVSSIQGSSTIYSSSIGGIKAITLPNKTGKIPFNIYAEDTACTVDKIGNSVNLSSVGNSVNISNQVWIDKTPPAVTVNADEKV